MSFAEEPPSSAECSSRNQVHFKPRRHREADPPAPASPWLRIHPTMKTKLLLFAASLCASAIAADASRILLKGASVHPEQARASGGARAIVGEVTVTAETITFDRQKNTLTCEGGVTIQTNAGTVKASNCVIELTAGERKIFFLSEGSIRVSPPVERLQYNLVPAAK
jgi:hypothetical protein